MDEKIFKAYDIRGIVPEQLNEDIAYLIGGAIKTVLNAKKIAVGRDVRLSSKMLEKALVRGLTEAGADVDILGEISTDALYFAVGKFKYDGGVMITASHNPPQYNGFKICRENAIPLSGKSGLPQIKEIVASGKFPRAEKNGKITEKNIIDDYIAHCLSFIDTSKLIPFKIAVDTGNGVAGIFLPKLFEKLPFEITPLFWEPDGNFPNHLPSPIEPENTQTLRETVIRKKLDFGVAFDGDADRMFIVDEKGQLVGGDIITAMVSRNMLEKYPGSKIVYNLICSKTVPEIVKKYGGTPIRSRVGHAFIKPIMREQNAVFGGEHSGHFYFRDNWFADSGLIAFLVVAELLSQEKKTPSKLIAEMDKYFRTGEINTRIEDREKTLQCVSQTVSEETNKEPDTTDGITFDFGDWWFNLRPSNTEPLIRLNLEASSKKQMDEKKDWILAIIEKCSG
ncbi:phosphomannomutase/phosphoglucomutase [bacterium]|nr:phosphomannomutase/phosphoglucomutase [bacterium]